MAIKIKLIAHNWEATSLNEDENKGQKEARFALAGEVMQIMVEVFKIADQLPGKDMPRYLPELESFRNICRMYGKDIFEVGRKLYLDMTIWNAMPDGVVIMEKPISIATLRGSLKNRLRDVAHEFGFKFRD